MENHQKAILERLNPNLPAVTLEYLEAEFKAVISELKLLSQSKGPQMPIETEQPPTADVPPPSDTLPPFNEPGPPQPVEVITVYPYFVSYIAEEEETFDFQNSVTELTRPIRNQADIEELRNSLIEPPLVDIVILNWIALEPFEKVIHPTTAQA